MALSRRHSPDCAKWDDWNGIHDLCEMYIGSHDAFVFAPPVPARVLKNTHHTQINLGAENIVIWAFLWAANFTEHGSNPCKRIKGMHLHCGVERHYTSGKWIDSGRHGILRPGTREDVHKPGWNMIY